MRFLLVVAVLLFAPFVARANEVDDRGGRVAYLEREDARLAGERLALARTYDEKAAFVTTLKAQPASWARDRKLQSALAESRDMAARLDKKDAEIRGIAGVLLVERRALIAAIDRELTATPAPAAVRATQLGKRRGELVAAVSRRPLHVPEWTLEPDDDADDLAYKAAALAESERALRAEEVRLTARVAYFRKQAKLGKSRARADEQDVFADEEPRRGKGSRGGDDRAETGGASDTVPVTPVPGDSTGTGFESPPAGATTPTALDTRTLDLTADPSVILSGVVAAGTVDELRRAEKSGDPESMARAAERAGQEVEARAARLRALRQQMEQRAAVLRGESK